MTEPRDLDRAIHFAANSSEAMLLVSIMMIVITDEQATRRLGTAQTVISVETMLALRKVNAMFIAREGRAAFDALTDRFETLADTMIEMGRPK